MRDWQPTWRDRSSPLYLLTLRRMIMASINWIEHNPMARPEWREAPSTMADQDLCWSDWRTVFEPTNDDAQRWFSAIATAADGPASSLLLAKAIAAGILMHRYGWYGLDQMMRDSNRNADLS